MEDQNKNENPLGTESNEGLTNDAPQSSDSPIQQQEQTAPSYPREQTLRQSMDLRPVTDKFRQLMGEANKLLVGQEELLELMLICILCDGHILLEGVPGIAKTLSANVLAKCVDSDFSRIQFTPDLMPADILGTSVFNMKEAEFVFKQGPVFTNICLIDEINRAPAKTQSALFEVMEEKQVSFDGTTYKMGFPFMVIATQNPIEQEGTYRLPEAQLDRFLMKINLEYPNIQEEVQILQRFKNQIGKLDLSVIQKILTESDIKEIQDILAKVHIEDQMLQYIADLIHETRNHSKIYLGASPRASIAILRTCKVAAVLAGRDFVIPDDIQYVISPVLNHRLILTAEAEMEGLNPKQVIDEILKSIEVPR